MKLAACLAMAAALSLPALADESVKESAKKLEDQTNKSLEKARKHGRKGAKNLEKGANDAAHKFRQKLGTEK